MIGRNLTDSRPYATESEIGDSQFDVAPSRGSFHPGGGHFSGR